MGLFTAIKQLKVRPDSTTGFWEPNLDTTSTAAGAHLNTEVLCTKRSRGFWRQVQKSRPNKRYPVCTFHAPDNQPVGREQCWGSKYSRICEGTRKSQVNFPKKRTEPPKWISWKPEVPSEFLEEEKVPSKFPNCPKKLSPSLVESLWVPWRNAGVTRLRWAHNLWSRASLGRLWVFTKDYFSISNFSFVTSKNFL